MPRPIKAMDEEKTISCHIEAQALVIELDEYASKEGITLTREAAQAFVEAVQACVVILDQRRAARE